MTKHTSLIFFLTAVLLFWSGLVFWSYFNIPLWMDEAITVFQISGVINNFVFETFTPGNEIRSLYQGSIDPLTLSLVLLKMDVHPPLYYISAELWTRLFGDATSTIRLLSTLFAGGAAALFVMFKTQSRWARMATLPLFLSAPTVLYAAGNTRGYGLALFLVTAAFYFMHQTLDKESKEEPIGVSLWCAILCSSLAFFTHYFTVMALFVPTLMMLPKLVKTTHRTWVYTSILVFLSALAAYPYLKFQLGAREGQYAGFESFFIEIKATLYYISRQMTVAQDYTLFLYGAIILAGLGFMTLIVKSRFDAHARLHLAAITGFFGLVLVLFWITDKTIAGTSYRYFVFTLPSFIFGISKFVEFFGQKGLAAGGIVSLAFVLPLFQNDTVHLQPWSSANQVFQFEKELIENRPNGGKVVIPGNGWGNGHIMSVLNKQDNVILTNDISILERSIDQAMQDQSFILSSAPGWDKNFQEYMKTQHERITSCGFERVSKNLWVEKEKRCQNDTR